MGAMPSPTVLVVLGEGVEEIEAVAPIDILRRAGAEVTVASVGGGIHVTGRTGITIHADMDLAAASGREYGCVLIPGGPAARRLMADPAVLGLLRAQNERQGLIAAICAAPLVLQAAGVLGNRRYTAHPSVRPELAGAETGRALVSDGGLITASGAGNAIGFGLAVAESLLGRERAIEVATSICAGYTGLRQQTNRSPCAE